VFCETPAALTPEGRLTEEHAYPRWISGELTPPVGDVQWQIGGGVLPEHRLFEVPIEAVCRSCNTGWLSEKFEKKVAKWLRPRLLSLEPELVLDQNQRAVVGAWAIKTALMVELALAELRGISFVPERHFRWLHEHQSPPPGCTVWMFGVNIGSGPKVAVVESGQAVWAMLAWTRADKITHMDPPGDLTEGYFATFTAGYIGFQVIGWDLDERDLDNRRPWLLRPRVPQNVQIALKQMWPAPRKPPLRWPWSSDGTKTGPKVMVTPSLTAMELFASWPWRSLNTTARTIPALPFRRPPVS
jgi:hypothetical protein